MISESLCHLDVESILPFLTNRAEAESLIGVTVLAHQLRAAVTALVAATKHEHLLGSLHTDILSSNNKFNRAVRPLLAKGRRLVVERKPVQLNYIASILEELRKAEIAVRQYGTQNSALAKELDGTAPQVAATKLHLSRVELDLCEKIEVLINLSASKDALRKGDLAKKVEVLDFENDVHCTSPRSEGARTRRKCSRSETKGDVTSVRSAGGGVLSDVMSPADILRLYQSSVETDSPFVRAKHVNSEESEHKCEQPTTESDLNSSMGSDNALRRALKRKGVPDDPIDEENQALGSQNSSQSTKLTTNADL